jgi:lipopolysaccharide transport system ATP-binding protein
MSSDFAIRIEGLHKSFPIYEKPFHRLMQMVAPGDHGRWYREFHALKGIDLTVGKGETLGIVGRNGSGKSTLLQIICGTLAPSVGTVEVRGRVAALLELGAGFNPEFTGRENVYLNGTVLGLSREEVEARFDDIVAFSEIGEFIDQPVKTYSSGMYIRLAFAVAINVTPDVLIIDEALSVGDEAFQRKCYARIDAIRDAGATVLFVSHSSGSVVELCDRAILLDHGQMLVVGRPKFVVSRYQKMLYASTERAAQLREEILSEIDTGDKPVSTESLDARDGAGVVGVVDEMEAAYYDEGLKPSSSVRYASRGATIEQPHVETLDGRKVNVLHAGHEYVYCYQVGFQQAAVGVRFGMMIKTTSGLELGGGVSTPQGTSELMLDAGQTVQVRFRYRCLLAPGTYFFNAGVLGHSEGGETFLDRLVDAAMFRVQPDENRIATGHVDFHITPDVHVHADVEITQ